MWWWNRRSKKKRKRQKKVDKRRIYKRRPNPLDGMTFHDDVELDWNLPYVKEEDIDFLLRGARTLNNVNKIVILEHS